MDIPPSGSAWPSAPVGGWPGRGARIRALAPAVTRAQGWYYLVGGLWRLAHPRSFEWVSGPKPDQFQTDVAAALFAAAGAALLTGTADRARGPVTRVLAAGTAVAVAAVDVKYRREIRSLFLVEAALELVMAAAAGTGRVAGSRVAEASMG
jgi:hypothetical protein